MALSLRNYFADLKRSFGATVGSTSGAFDFYSGDDEWSGDTSPEDYLGSSPAVYMATRYRSQKLASVPLAFYRVAKGGKKTVVTTGSLVELMTKVNPFWTAARLYEMTEMSLCLRGKSFWALDRGTSSRGEPREIWWMHPDRVKVVRGGDYISHFEYDPGYGQPIQWAKEEVLWLRYPNPANEFDGLAPLSAARIIADTGSAAMTSNRKMFSQGMQLAGFVSPVDRNDTWTKETGREIEESLARRFSGANKAHRWAVLGRQMAFQSLSVSPKDIEFIELLKWSFEDVCRVFGLSPDLLGGERTYANAAEARLAFWQDTMIPECAFFANEITEQLLPLFPGQADIAEFDVSGVDVLQEREDAKWERWKEQITLGARTINEERDKAGLKPLPWGDAYWKPNGLEPITTEDQTQPPEPPPPAMPPASVTEADPLALPEGAPRRRTRAMEYGSAEHERIWRAFVRQTDPHETTFGRMTADLMRRQKQSMLAKLNNQRGLGTRDVAEIADDPFDKGKWVKEFRQQARPVMRVIVDEVGKSALEDLGLTIAFDVQDPNVTRFLMQRAQRFAVEVNETTWTDLKTSLSEGIDAGEGIDELARRVDQVMGDRIRSSAQVIARTEVIGAANGGTLLSYRQSGVVAGKRWLAALDDRTRDTHVMAHGQERAIDEDFDVGGGSGPHPGAIGLASEDIQCFPADTIVYAENIHAGMMRVYSGPMVKIMMRDSVVSVTPNHPLLTDTGWKVAGDIAEGDDLIGYSLVEDSIAPSPYPDEAPAKIGEIFSLALVSGHSRRIPGARPQFHGDGACGDVDIVWPARQLLRAGNPTMFDPSRQQVLAASDINAADLPGHGEGEQISIAASFTPDGFVRGGSQRLPILGARLGHAQVHSFASPSRNNAVLMQDAIDNPPAHAEVLGKRLYRRPGTITVNKVIGVEINSFHGNVYNLHTESNHYLANGIITHNCRCTMQGVLDFEWAGPKG